MLAWTIYISFLGVLVLLLLPKSSVRAARVIALLTAMAGFAVTAGGICAAAIGRAGDGCAGALGSVARHRVSPGGGWNQPDAAAADGHRGDCRGLVLLEH